MFLMADQLFYSYNSNGTASKSLNESNAHPYSLIFDEGRNSIWEQGKEFGVGVFSADEHYTPNTDNSSKIEVDASGGSAGTHGSTQVVTGVNLSRDTKGHVTGMTVDSIKLPAETQLSGGQAATSGKYVSGVTVSGHAVSVTQASLPVTSYYDVLTKGLYTTGLQVGQGFRMSESASSITYATYSYSDIYVPYASHSKDGAMTAADYDKLNLQNISATEDVHADLNSYVTSGLYHSPGGYAGSEVTPYIDNLPPGVTNGGFLLEVKNLGVAHYAHQTLYHKGGRVFERTKKGASAGWTDWKTINNTNVSLGTNSGSSNKYVSGLSISSTSGSYIITASYASLPTLSMGSGTGGTGKAITQLTVSGHQITASYGTFLTAHQTIPVTSYYDVLTKGNYTSGLKVGTGFRMSGSASSITYATYSYSDIYVPIMTNSAYGVAKAYYGKLTSNKKVQDQTILTNRYYGVQTTIDGKLVVNVPWTNINNDYVDIQLFESLDMVGRSETTGYMIALGDVNQSINQIVIIPPMSASGYGVAKVGDGDGKVNINTSGQLTYGHINKGTGTVITGSSVAGPGNSAARQNIITNIYATTDTYGHIVSMSYDYLSTGSFDLGSLANLSGNVVSYTPGTNYINNIEVATTPGTNLNTLYIIL